MGGGCGTTEGGIWAKIKLWVGAGAHHRNALCVFTRGGWKGEVRQP